MFVSRYVSTYKFPELVDLDIICRYLGLKAAIVNNAVKVNLATSWHVPEGELYEAPEGTLVLQITSLMLLVCAFGGKREYDRGQAFLASRLPTSIYNPKRVKVRAIDVQACINPSKLKGRDCKHVTYTLRGCAGDVLFSRSRVLITGLLRWQDVPPTAAALIPLVEDGEVPELKERRDQQLYTSDVAQSRWNFGSFGVMRAGLNWLSDARQVRQMKQFNEAK